MKSSIPPAAAIRKENACHAVNYYRTEENATAQKVVETS